MARGVALSGEALAASQKRYKPPPPNPPGRREGSSRHAAGLHDGARGAAGWDHRRPDGDGGGSVERPPHQRQREESGSEDVRDSGSFCKGGGGCSKTTDVANVTAALKLALAAEQGGDTSSSSGGGSRHGAGAGAGVSAAEGRPADGGGTASADVLPAPTGDPPPLQEMRVHAVAATKKAVGGGAEGLPAAVPRRGGGSGGGGSARIRRFFGGGEEPAVESATAAAPRPDCPAKETTATNGLQSAAEERSAEAMAAAAGEQGASKPRAGSGRVRKGKQRGGRAAGTGARKKRAWALWDLAKPPTVGDRFDCLDYFVSSQTGLSAEKWRGAEVMDVRHANKGTQVLVSAEWVPELLASERAHQDSLGSAGESSSAASTATMTNSSASSIGTLGGGGGGGGRGGGGITGGLGSASAKGDEDAIAGLSDPALSKSRVHSGGGGSRDGSRRGGTGGTPKRTAAAAAAPAGGVRARGPSPVAARGGDSGGRGSPTGGSGEDSEEAAADRAFREAMRRTGLSVVDVEPDGNCLFRSVSHQIYGDADRHYPVRKACVEHMYRHRARFGVFVAEDFRDYLFRIRQPGVWGDDLEIRALEEMFDRPIEIYSSESEGLQPMKIDFDASGIFAMSD
ncbi:OTU-like cysteine protease family protein [Ectocarpus siliculosus]|uniref:ubiquitinyl hydrolase 1 n=1 Tax=Ectocarpus siliculosus TaxID=2880 RepID=D8LLK1_ECTSI|nr:OTU-like cysteine protease family protein [Ectocarpus siliculosus]|eukprot:CBN74632.1 OTU-like cysteine protease family protein [Ectocarpus siliculosus]